MSEHHTALGEVQGTRLGDRYQVDRVLSSEGGVTRVLAHDAQEPNRLLMIESWPAPSISAALREQERAHLAEFVPVLRQVALPGLAPVRAVEIPDHSKAISVISDYVPGLTLLEEMEEGDGTVQWRTYVEWAHDLCGTLAALHALHPPYVLGSLHPGAVQLAVGTHRPILTDLGLHRRSTQIAGLHPGYVPFEQVLGREEPRSDIYALGALLHCLLSARDPDAEYLRLRRSGQDVQSALRVLFPPLDTRALHIPDALAMLVARCLAFSPQDRFPDAAALLNALHSVRGPASAVETNAPPEPSDDPVWMRLGLTQEQWFALPLQQRNRMLLESLGKQGLAGS